MLHYQFDVCEFASHMATIFVDSLYTFLFLILTCLTANLGGKVMTLCKISFLLCWLIILDLRIVIRLIIESDKIELFSLKLKHFLGMQLHFSNLFKL